MLVSWYLEYFKKSLLQFISYLMRWGSFTLHFNWLVRRAKSPVFRDKFKGDDTLYELLFFIRDAVLIVRFRYSLSWAVDQIRTVGSVCEVTN